MKNLYIIGARGYGREVAMLATQARGCNIEFKIAGFLDDKADALDGMPGYPPIVSTVEDFQPTENDVFICALGEPYYRKKYAEIILAKGGEFINLIHKRAIISANVKMGFGCIVSELALLSCDITIGNFCCFQSYSVVGHDAIIGDFSMIGAFAFLGGGAQLGRCVTVHPSANILPHKKVGDNAVVGAGSVVIRNVPDDTTVYGNPAQRLKL